MKDLFKGSTLWYPIPYYPTVLRKIWQLWDFCNLFKFLPPSSVTLILVGICLVKSMPSSILAKYPYSLSHVLQSISIGVLIPFANFINNSYSQYYCCNFGNRTHKNTFKERCLSRPTFGVHLTNVTIWSSTFHT